MGMMDAATSPAILLNGAGAEIRALYVAGGFLPSQLEGNEDALSHMDFLVVQELFQNATTSTPTSFCPLLPMPRSMERSPTTMDSYNAFVNRLRRCTRQKLIG
jgi:Uncharacterized anaerobic dehydrogenase